MSDMFTEVDRLTVQINKFQFETICYGATVYPDEESMITWAEEALRLGEIDIEGVNVALVNVAVIPNPFMKDRNIARLTFVSDYQNP